MTDTVELAAAPEPVPFDPLLRATVEDFYYRYASACDRTDFDAILDCFTEQGEYLLTTFENARGQGLLLVADRSHAALRERLAYLGGYWNLHRSKTSHLISNVRVVGRQGEALAVQAVMWLSKLDQDGASRFHVSAEYDDLLVPDGDSWAFARHSVVLDGETLPSDLTDLL